MDLASLGTLLDQFDADRAEQLARRLITIASTYLPRSMAYFMMTPLGQGVAVGGRDRGVPWRSGGVMTRDEIEAEINRLKLERRRTEDLIGDLIRERPNARREDERARKELLKGRLPPGMVHCNREQNLEQQIAETRAERDSIIAKITELVQSLRRRGEQQGTRGSVESPSARPQHLENAPDDVFWANTANPELSLLAKLQEVNDCLEYLRSRREALLVALENYRNRTRHERHQDDEDW